MYEDYRAQMHRRVAQTIPDTPEATAILTGELVKPMTFGGLVTKLVETGTVEATSMDAVRTGVSGTLGIDEAEVTERLADSRLIEGETAWCWVQNYERRGEAQLRSGKEAEAKARFDRVILERIDGTNLDKIQPRIDGLSTKIAELEAQVADFEAQDLPFRAIPAKILLNSHQSELRAIKSSAYAVSLGDLIEILKQDELLKAYGEEFARGVIDGFAGWLCQAKKLPEARWMNDLFSGDIEYLEDNALALMQNTWLSQADVAMFSSIYADCYYGSSQDAPGRVEVEALPNPVRDALIISKEERTAFFDAYPLANGMQPRH